MGEVKSCGVYPCHLKWITDPRCRFCGYSCETTVHLLNDCPDTTAIQIDHGISFHTLVNETPENILLLIVHFNAFIQHVLGCYHWTSNPSLESILNDYEHKRKSPSDTTKQSEPQNKNHKRHRLIIPHEYLPHCGKCRCSHTKDQQHSSRQ